MSVIDNATNHFKEQENRIIEVKEWNAKFLIKPMTLDEQRRLLDKTKTNQVEAMVDLIVMKCLNEDGTKAFKLEDKKNLMTEADPNVVVDLVNKIGVTTTIEDQKKS